MGRAARIAVTGVLSGLLMTLAVVTLMSPPAPRASAPVKSGADAHPAPAAIPGHCRSVTAPDAGCEAAWDAKRRRFFGKKD
ncbi:putative entry exclusion protein TrbK-alt [Sphingopyxis sp.]|uniref:putative entry exclusion protein TrbK-alt n=1 Tax=Sphingopyxis sp. TaxID=1908224 RepID=UPI002D77A8FC|nr:putative entry exclusion protein TrbK-alt [Sphingopyxis sp.]HET6523582.1 putative entry exclusion protein TrbK-alt [Sphingopyxis sp.]